MKKITRTKIHKMQNNILLNVLKNCKYTIFIVCVCFLTENTYSQEIVSKKLRKVVIDPGHGGKDPGAIGSFSKEKDIVLAVSLKLAELIQEKHPDVKVIMTREDDTFIELYQRAAIANKAKADLFISVHANSNKKKDPSGVEFYVLGLHKSEENLEVAKKENAVVNLEGNVTENYGFDPNSAEGNIIMTMKQSLFLDNSIHFAKKIENEFKNDDNQSIRGTKQAGFLVLYQTAMPSCLLEIGFISNTEEEEYMNSKLGQINIATKIANAFTEYKRKFEGKNADIPATNEPSAAEKKASIEKQLEQAEKLKAEKAGYPNAMKEAEMAQKLTQAKEAAKQPALTIEPIKEMTKIPSKPFIEEQKEKAKAKENKPAPRKIIIVEEDTPLEMVSNTNSTENEAPKTSENKENTMPKTKPKVEVAPEVVDVQKQKILDEKLKLEEKAKAEAKKMEAKVEPKIEKKQMPKIIIDDNEIDRKVTMAQPKNNNTNEPTTKPNAVLNTPKATYTAPKSGLVYKIQVKASQRKIDGNDIVYGSFPDVRESMEDGMYKYLTGEFKNIDEAKKHREFVKMKGYADAFIVKYENGVRIK
jgi:N-acetylmuramoyl-L-alanine amidase